jgi:hypothetical protein
MGDLKLDWDFILSLVVCSEQVEVVTLVSDCYQFFTYRRDWTRLTPISRTNCETERNLAHKARTKLQAHHQDTVRSAGPAINSEMDKENLFPRSGTIINCLGLAGDNDIVLSANHLCLLACA